MRIGYAELSASHDDDSRISESIAKDQCQADGILRTVDVTMEWAQGPQDEDSDKRQRIIPAPLREGSNV